MATGPAGVITSKVLERVSNGVISTPRDAYVADIATPATRGACYGIMMTGKTIGCIIGPFLVSFFAFFTEDYRVLLWIGFVPCMIAILMLWRGMKEKTAISKTDQRKPPFCSFKNSTSLIKTESESSTNIFDEIFGIT